MNKTDKELIEEKKYQLQLIVDNIECTYDKTKLYKQPLYHLTVPKKLHFKYKFFIDKEYADYAAMIKYVRFWYKYKYNDAANRMFMPKISDKTYDNYAEAKENCIKWIKWFENIFLDEF